MSILELAYICPWNSLVKTSPASTVISKARRYEGRETIASKRSLFHRAQKSTWRLRQNVKFNDITSSCFGRNIRDLNFQRFDGNENVKITKKTQTICLISKTTTLHVHDSFFCTATSWKCLISRFRKNVNEQRPNFISFSEHGYGPFAYNIWQSKWVEIIAINTVRAQIYSRLALRQRL